MSNCNVTILDCSRAADLKRLKHFQKIEREQKSHFTRYLTLDSYGCKQKDLIYFIAVKPATLTEKEQLCGVAQTELSGLNTVHVNYLTSRAATDSSYRGVGTMLLNAVINLYKDDPRIFGINLTAVSSAVPFYLKFGFKPNGEDTGDMFYPLERYYKFEHYDKQTMINHIKLAIERKDRDLLDDILYEENLRLRDIVQTNAGKRTTDKKFIYMSIFLIENYFNQLYIDNELFYTFYEEEDYNSVIALIKRNPSFIKMLDENDITYIIKNLGRRTFISFLQTLSDGKYKFTEDQLKYVIENKPNQEAIKIMYNTGIKLTDKYFIYDYIDALSDIERKYYAYRTAIDIWHSQFTGLNE
jgi:predicted GNAT family N-acyltransferase